MNYSTCSYVYFRFSICKAFVIQWCVMVGSPTNWHYLFFLVYTCLLIMCMHLIVEVFECNLPWLWISELCLHIFRHFPSPKTLHLWGFLQSEPVRRFLTVGDGLMSIWFWGESWTVECEPRFVEVNAISKVLKVVTIERYDMLMRVLTISVRILYRCNFH